MTDQLREALFAEFGWTTREAQLRAGDRRLAWGDIDNPAWAEVTERIRAALTPTPDTLAAERHQTPGNEWPRTWNGEPATPSPDTLDAHEPGEAHRYGPLICEVCGVRGQVRVSLVPEYAARLREARP